jgi:hypothetical protein
MKRVLLSICVMLIVTAARAPAQTNTPAAPVKLEPLSAMAWFVGGTWTSEVKDDQDGSVTHVAERIRWSPNHQAIVFNVDFNGKPHYDGFYAYNPATKKIDFYYTNSEGELTIGTVTPDSDGKTFHQEFDIMHVNGNTGHVRSMLVRDGDNAYWFSVLMNRNGEWQQVFHIRYERKPE